MCKSLLTQCQHEKLSSTQPTQHPSRLSDTVRSGFNHLYMPPTSGGPHVASPCRPTPTQPRASLPVCQLNRGRQSAARGRIRAFRLPQVTSGSFVMLPGLACRQDGLRFPPSLPVRNYNAAWNFARHQLEQLDNLGFLNRTFQVITMSLETEILWKYGRSPTPFVDKSLRFLLSFDAYTFAPQNHQGQGGASHRAGDR